MDVLSLIPGGYAPEAPASARTAERDRSAENPSEFDAMVSEAEDASEDVRAPARPRRDRSEPRDKAETEGATSSEPQSEDVKAASAKASESEPGKTAADKPASSEQNPAAETPTADGETPVSGAALANLMLPADGIQATAPTAPATNLANPGAHAQTAPQLAAPTLAVPTQTPAAAPAAQPQTPAAPDALAAQAPAPVATPEAASTPAAAPTVPNAQPATTAPAATQAAAALASPAPEVPAQNPRADRDAAKTAKTSDGKNAARTTAADPAASAGKPAAPGADAATVKTAATAERPVVSVQDQGQPADAANAAGQADPGQTIDATDAGGLRRTETAHAAQAPDRAGPHRGPAIDIAALATRFAARVQNGATQFSIRLDPAELGRVEVRLEVGSDGVAHARLIAERPEALAELSRNARVLERELADAGVDLSRGGLSFELAGGDAGQAQERDRGFAEARPAFVNAEEAEPIAQAADALAEIDTAYGFSVLRRGRLDVRI